MKYVMCLGDPDGLKRHVLGAVPITSMAEFWLPLHYFDYSEQAKNGCILACLSRNASCCNVFMFSRGLLILMFQMFSVVWNFVHC